MGNTDMSKFALLHSTKTREEIQGLVLCHWRDGHTIHFETYSRSGHKEIPECRGTCKWTGCIDWHTDGGHFCCPEHADAWRAIFARVWELARELDQ